MDSDDLVLLVSYPRTGSNWLRLLIVEALLPGHEDSAAVIPSYLKAFPESSPRFPLRHGACRILKTHLHPDDPRIRTVVAHVRGIISIRRHPLDVLLSSLNYAHVKNHAASFLEGRPRPVEEIVSSGEIEHYIRQFISDDGIPWHNAQSRSFSGFVRSWRQMRESLPCHDIRYEDLVADTAEETAGLLRFLGVDLDGDAIARTISKVDQWTAPDGKLIWQRKASNFTSLLDAGLVRQFTQAYGEILRDIGYSD